MQKFFFPFLLLLFLAHWSANAQTMDDRIYRIRLAAAKGQVLFERYNKLTNYGALFFEPADNGYTRIYLGSYIGKSTAQRILNLVKARGFKSAYLVLDQNLYTSDTPENIEYFTYQICATKKLNTSKIIQKLNPVDAQNFHLRYSNGFYQYSLGIFDRGILPATEQTIQALAFSIGYKEGFAKKIRR